MVYLVYRYDKNGKIKGGPYAVRAVRLRGCETPRQEYLGPAIVEPDGTIISKRTGEVLGHRKDVVKLTHDCSETMEDAARRRLEELKKYDQQLGE